MADLKSLKTKSGKSRFGALPEQDANLPVLSAPETAPPLDPSLLDSSAASEPKKRKKARGKTDRTTPWGTSVQKDFGKRFRVVAALKGLKHAELLERWLEAEEKKLGIKS